MFFVGDCAGIDTAAQQYLDNAGYRKVWIHASYNPTTDSQKTCRNNLGNWDVHYIASQAPSGTYEYRHDKDRAMLDICDEALCIWDGKSKATADNFRTLMEKLKKPCYFQMVRPKFPRRKIKVQIGEQVIETDENICIDFGNNREFLVWNNGNGFLHNIESWDDIDHYASGGREEMGLVITHMENFISERISHLI